MDVAAAALPPIAVMSFNRPDYLREVLASLAAQQGAQIGGRRVFLFQDGWRNAYSGRICAEASATAACIAVFREIFPAGEVMAAPDNLGVAENFLRAETHLFRTLGASCGYFFEDDLVLAPRYLATLDRLREAAEPAGGVGYFACYGHLQASEAEQRRDAAKLRRIGHLWGFGLFREHWERMQPLMKEYYDLVVGRDYRARPHAEIQQRYRGRGILVGVTSQDDVKKAVTCALGRIGLNTTLVHARYVGEFGLHSNPRSFERGGYARTVLLTDVAPPDFAFPDAAGIAAMCEEERRGRLRKIEMEAEAAGAAAAPAPAPDAPTPVRLGASVMLPEELALFERTLAGRRRYAEWGTGGSTPLALRLGVETLVAIESDPAWAKAVRAAPEVAAAAAEGRASVLHADIGPVGGWGAPASAEPAKSWPRYIAAMWQEWARRGSFPDAVLVDGRFRLGCCFSVALMHACHRGTAEPPLVMLRNLSESRPAYAAVFEAFRRVEQAGTLCVMAPRDDVPPEAMLALLLGRVLEAG
ncbi:hypothetical protein [Falsiroseomonas sp. HW251]|uniref:hypothetical protein n=1 Tax=Falsiroseomonas sp. HW251 TaxID=3390998 RepID=UPI003D319960